MGLTSEDMWLYWLAIEQNWEESVPPDVENVDQHDIKIQRINISWRLVKTLNSVSTGSNGPTDQSDANMQVRITDRESYMLTCCIISWLKAKKVLIGFSPDGGTRWHLNHTPGWTRLWKQLHQRWLRPPLPQLWPWDSKLLLQIPLPSPSPAPAASRQHKPSEDGDEMTGWAELVVPSDVCWTAGPALCEGSHPQTGSNSSLSATWSERSTAC